MGKKIRISKLDAATRQLNMAIKLYLSHSDPVSTHTLIGASHEVLRNIANSKGIETFIKDKMIDEYDDEATKKIARKKINDAQNFFKHADRDQDESLNFNPEQTEALIWDACNIYYEVTSERQSSHIAFLAYFYAKNPFALKDKKARKLTSELRLNSADTKDRSFFLGLIPDIDKNLAKIRFT